MRALLWRLLYAVVCYFLFWWIFPLFISAIGVPVTSSIMELARAVTAAIAFLYVVFGPAPPYPW
jgi:hypothetical protein